MPFLCFQSAVCIYVQDRGSKIIPEMQLTMRIIFRCNMNVTCHSLCKLSCAFTVENVCILTTGYFKTHMEVAYLCECVLFLLSRNCELTKLTWLGKKFASCDCWIAIVDNLNANSSALSLTFLEVLSLRTSNSVLGKCLFRAVSAAVPVVAWPNRIIGIIQLLGHSSCDRQQGSSAFSWAFCRGLQGSVSLYEGGKLLVTCWSLSSDLCFL